MKPLLSKTLSFGIVASSAFVKIPVFKNVFAIYKNSFTKAGKRKANPPPIGLSSLSLYTELFMFTHAALYGALSSYPFITYGDAASQSFQTLLLIILVGATTNTLASTIPKVLLAAAYFTSVFLFTPAALVPWLIRGNLLFVTVARGSQILKNFSGIKGAQSTFTVFAQVAGTGAKLFTTTQEIGFDFNLLSAYCVGFVLNSILLVQVATADGGGKAGRAVAGKKANASNGHAAEEVISTRQTSRSRADIRARNKPVREDREFEEVPVRRNTPRRAAKRGTPLAN